MKSTPPRPKGKRNLRERERERERDENGGGRESIYVKVMGEGGMVHGA